VSWRNGHSRDNKVEVKRCVDCDQISTFPLSRPLIHRLTNESFLDVRDVAVSFFSAILRADYRRKESYPGDLSETL
jgi:hypothetical protein